MPQIIKRCADRDFEKYIKASSDKYGGFMKKFVVIFEKTSDGYSAYVPDLPGCVAFGDTREETEELIYEGIKFHIDGLINNGEEIPPSISETEVMVFV